MRKVRGCLRAVSIAEVNNGLYFKSTQQYLTAVSGLLTIAGIVVILFLSVFVFIGIFREEQI